jgi:acetyl-CoA C-acetyltransferase
MHPNTPILIGGGQYVDREMPTTENSLSPADINAVVSKTAISDTKAQGDIKSTIDVLAVARLFEHSVKGAAMWPNPYGCSNNMPWSVANRIGIKPRRAIYSEVGGETPQRLVNQFAEAIYAGEVGTVLITGAEALATIKKGKRAGLELDWQEEAEGDFEDLWPDLAMSSEYERRHGINYPISVYALFEQARRDRLGLNMIDYKRAIGNLFGPFSRLAASNPFAQFPTIREAADISTFSAENFPLCDPYGKWMVAQDSVNQGAALILTSVQIAQELGISQENWVYLEAYGDLDELSVLERQDLSCSLAQRLVLNQVVENSDRSIDAVDYLDFYSCFPVAVTSACEALGLKTDGSVVPTMTGGLPFFGGPGNNYSLHAIVESLWKIRGENDCRAVVAANGGYLSKHSVGLYSSTLKREWVQQTTAGAAELQRTKMLVREKPEGRGIVEGYSANYTRGEPTGGFIVGRTESNMRFMAVAEETDVKAVKFLFDEQAVGKTVSVRWCSEKDVNLFSVE